MKILAVIITPPTAHQSGGIAAGLQLSRAVSDLVDIEAAVMADRTVSETSGGLRVNYFRCNSTLGLPAALLPGQLRSLLWRSAELSEFIHCLKPDLVHFHNPYPAGALWQMCRSCLADRLPYVISGHGFVEISNFSEALGVTRWKRPMVRVLVTRPFQHAVRNASHLFLTSPFEKPVAAALGIPENRRSLVTNGVNPFYLKPADADLIRTLRERWKLSPQDPTFLFVGNHTVNKGLDILLEAAHKIRTDARILIAGRVRSRTEHRYLCRKYRVAALHERVIFTDALDDLELRALYQTADAFVFPSRADTLPLVILEAMASGLPVIASRVGGIPYQITSENGILVPPGDSDALARAMEKLAGDPEARLRMGRAGHARVQDCFTWERSAEAAVQSYRQILEAQAGCRF
jgi:glycosyltransferase involved in cell wall biosynthesis